MMLVGIVLAAALRSIVSPRGAAKTLSLVGAILAVVLLASPVVVAEKQGWITVSLISHMGYVFYFIHLVVGAACAVAGVSFVFRASGSNQQPKPTP